MASEIKQAPSSGSDDPADKGDRAKDHWSSEAYKTSASFVPKLTQKVVSYLDVQPGDHILDLGCGDGVLTVKLAEAAPEGKVLGLDASAAMIESARKSSSINTSSLSYEVQDCTRLSDAPADIREQLVGKWDKVFSNAALHWILRNSDTRMGVLRDTFAALRPGGRFVFEMGGAGNVGEAVGALVGALMANGMPAAEARDASPWFFPSENWMQSALSSVGFEVEKLELEYRPTQLTMSKEGGMAGWFKLMGAQMLEKLQESKREAAIEWACAVLEDIITRPEDGSRYIGYVRLRGIARKPKV